MVGFLKKIAEGRIFLLRPSHYAIKSIFTGSEAGTQN
jgi:hypothetical protein